MCGMINTTPIFKIIPTKRLNIAGSSYWVQRDVLIKFGCVISHGQSFPILPERLWRKISK